MPPDSEPPRIRDERRDADLIRLKERLAIVESEVTKLEQLTLGMHYALFGLPDDRTNNGMVGEMHAIKHSLQSANNKLVGLLLTTLGAVAADILTRQVG